MCHKHVNGSLSPSLKDKLKRHAKFWHRETEDRPLLGYCSTGNEQAPGFELLGDGPVEPDQVNERLFVAYQDDFTFTSIRQDQPGDLLFTPLADCGLAWYEWIVGCEIHFTPATRMAWAESFADNIQTLRQRWRLPIQADEDPRLERLRFLLECKQKTFPNDPVPLVLGRGMIDLLVAAISSDEVVISLQMDPSEYRVAFEDLASMITLMTKEQLRVIKPLNGGYTNRRGLWAPGSICMTQEDGSSLLSPHLFADLLIPANRRIWSEFDYSMMHTHSAGLAIMIDGLLAAPELKCVESIVDPQGPSLDELLPMWRRIQASGKCLLILSELPPEEIQTILEALDPTGLALSISTNHPESYEALRRG